MKKISLCIFLLLGSPAYADTCKYEDADGRVIYSNLPMKGAKKLMCFGFEPPPSKGSTASGSKSARMSQPTPSNFPRVDSDTQKQRDETRKKILQDELVSEQRALEQAKQEYAEKEASSATSRTQAAGKDGKPQAVARRDAANFDEKLKALQDNVTLHEKNIQMLQKELSGIK